MVFLGLIDQPKDNDDYVKMERRYDQAKREKLLREQEAEKLRKANESNSTETKKKENEKKTRKQRFKEGFRTAEAKLDVATTKGVAAYHKAELGAQKVNLGAKRFSEASATFRINPSSFDMSVSASVQSDLSTSGLDVFVPRTPKRHSGGVDLSLFDVSVPSLSMQKPKMQNRTPRGLSDPLVDSFTVRSSGEKPKNTKSDALFDLMAVGGFKPSKSKRKAKKQWSWA